MSDIPLCVSHLRLLIFITRFHITLALLRQSLRPGVRFPPEMGLIHLRCFQTFRPSAEAISSCFNRAQHGLLWAGLILHHRLSALVWLCRTGHISVYPHPLDLHMDGLGMEAVQRLPIMSWPHCCPRVPATVQSWLGPH